MITWKGEVNMFDDWTENACPIIPTNLTPYANAGIAQQVRKYTPPNEFGKIHEKRPEGGAMRFTNKRWAWDLPTKWDIKRGSESDIRLIEAGMEAFIFDAYYLAGWGIDTILIPKLGAGLGKLDWQDVWDAISYRVAELSNIFHVNIYSEVMNERVRIKIPVRV